MATSIDNVWFNSKGRLATFGYTYEDSGSLLLTEEYLEYIGRKIKFKVPLNQIQEVVRSKIQGNPMAWLRLSLGETDQLQFIYFKSGNRLGWESLDEIENAVNYAVTHRQKKCLYCAEYIKYEAKVCKFCGRDQA